MVVRLALNFAAHLAAGVAVGALAACAGPSLLDRARMGSSAATGPEEKHGEEPAPQPPTAS